jgi:hypothetical protein
MDLPTIRLGEHDVSRLIIGGNPLSAISHFSAEMDRAMLEYYTMPNLQAALAACQAAGINTIQSRGDRHQMRMILEHRLGGGGMQWIAQTASEFADHAANIRQIAGFGPIAIYIHGTFVDNSWHEKRFDRVRDELKIIRDLGLPAGVGTHIPEVIEHCEAHGWETDFYMACMYNLARGYKSAPAVDRDAYAREKFQPEDPPRMCRTVAATAKCCLAFKIMAASRNCTTPAATRAAFEFAFARIKPTDAVVVGMFPKDRDQIAENAEIVRDILAAPARR